ncbi:MAG: hydroxymethylbilane synthase [Flavobacteriales bacterium]
MKTLRIGTRDSPLARAQAERVQRQIAAKGFKTEISALKSQGDVMVDQPLYALGIRGIFTKTLDVALLQGRIDLAVHSLKDVPTQLPQGISQIAVLARGPTADVWVKNEAQSQSHTLATGSLRRRAFWLHRFPTDRVVNLRGRVQTRLRKVAQNPWKGGVFAEAGLAHMGLLHTLDYERLDWMIPAPAQGAIGVYARSSRKDLVAWRSWMNHEPTAICTRIERDFLSALEGGCSAPIGALAQIKGDALSFSGALLSIDGAQKIAVSQSRALDRAKDLGREMAQRILVQGGAEIRAALRRQMT